MDQPEVDRGEWTRRGIDVMMAWTQADSDDFAFATQRVMDYVNDPEGLVPLTLGLLNVAGFLLGNLAGGDMEKARGILREIAARTV